MRRTRCPFDTSSRRLFTAFLQLCYTPATATTSTGAVATTARRSASSLGRSLTHTSSLSSGPLSFPSQTSQSHRSRLSRPASVAGRSLSSTSGSFRGTEGVPETWEKERQAPQFAAVGANGSSEREIIAADTATNPSEKVAADSAVTSVAEGAADTAAKLKSPKKKKAKTKNTAKSATTKPKSPQKRESREVISSGEMPKAASKGKKPRSESSSEASKATEAKIEVKPERKLPPWLEYKNALKRKFPEGWNPRKKISPDAMEGMRALHQQYPEECTREVLAAQFKISQEAVRRILKAKPRHVNLQAMQRERWAKRHDQIWDNMSQLGLRPKRTKDQPTDEKTFTMPVMKRDA